MVGLFDKAVPVLADENRIGGSAIFNSTVQPFFQNARIPTVANEF